MKPGAGLPGSEVGRVATECEHGAEGHDGTEPSLASAPEKSRAWLLVEHPGPWAAEPAETPLPAPLDGLVILADALGIRVQMIRRPGRRPASEVRNVFAGWTAGGPGGAGDEPWLRRGETAPTELDLKELATGIVPAFGAPVSEPVFLVCAHGRRNACCARFGAPLAAALSARYPGQIWETTHVGGHRFAANLVILPHGLYYGPVGVPEATAAIAAYQRGMITSPRYRGRAGQPKPAQEAEYARLAQTGSLEVAALA
jgi:hypothetical protein